VYSKSAGLRPLGVRLPLPAPAVPRQHLHRVPITAVTLLIVKAALTSNAIRFIFEYPDSPLHTTFRWSPEKDSWEWLMEQKDKDGKWTSFADLKVARGPR